MARRPPVLAAAALAAALLAAACGADPGSPARVAVDAGDPAGSGGSGGSGGDATPTEAPTEADFTGDLPVADAVDLRGKAEVTVQVKDNTYTLRDATQEETRVIRVDAGTKVVFQNDGANPHNVIPSVAGAFTEIPTGKLDPGQTGSVRFEKAGLYPYHCSIHGTRNKGQRGLVVVGDS